MRYEDDDNDDDDDELFCEMVDRRKVSNFIFSRDHCHRFPPSQISITPRARFEHEQNLGPGVPKWNCTVVITTTFGATIWSVICKKMWRKCLLFKKSKLMALTKAKILVQLIDIPLKFSVNLATVEICFCRCVSDWSHSNIKPAMESCLHKQRISRTSKISCQYNRRG